jgi:hypothetical protein
VPAHLKRALGAGSKPRSPGLIGLGVGGRKEVYFAKYYEEFVHEIEFGLEGGRGATHEEGA